MPGLTSLALPRFTVCFTRFVVSREGSSACAVVFERFIPFSVKKNLFYFLTVLHTIFYIFFRYLTIFSETSVSAPSKH